MRGWLARAAALTALAASGLAVALTLLGDDAYEVRARFEAVAGVVTGQQVKAGGRSVGKIEHIGLTPDGRGEILMRIDEDFAPLRVGTIARIRQPSLSSVAGRYVDLMVPDGRVAEEIPDGGVIHETSTTSSTDFDHLFDTFDAPTRRALTRFIRGQGIAHEDGGEALDAGLRYLDPALLAGTRLFDEINRDTPQLERFLVEQSKLMADLAAERDPLSVIVDRLADATRAIARERTSLERGIAALPPFLRRGNTTLLNLRATLDHVDPLVRESRPVAPKLRAALAQLRPFAREAVPTFRALADVISRTGPRNDLLELSRAVLPFRDIAVGPVNRSGAQREGSFPSATKSLSGSTKSLAFLRPYAVDFSGWFDDFSHNGVYDANGNVTRSATAVNAFATLNGVLAPIPPELRAEALKAVTRSSNNRCPGSNERGATYKPSPDFNCDETAGPLGP